MLHTDFCHFNSSSQQTNGDMINVTPLIDILLVVITILLLASAQAEGKIKKIDVSLPQVSHSESFIQNVETISVVLTKDGKMSVNQNDFPSIQALVEHIKLKHAEDSTILLQIDKDVKYQLVSETLSALQQQNFQNLSLVVSDLSS